jgi:hypothetical protein
VTKKPEQSSLFGDEPRAVAATRPAARTTDPPTSHAAARAAVIGFSRYVYQTLWLYSGYGETDESAWQRSTEIDGGQWRQGTVSKRRHRAMEKGLIEAKVSDLTGRHTTRVLDSGLEGIVWCLTERGRQIYEGWLRETGDPRRAQ